MAWLIPSFVLVCLFLNQNWAQQYQPNWQSLDARPLPLWYDEAKFGIFMHWGVYAVPAVDSEWLWFDWKNKTNQYINNFMQAHYRPGITYADFAKDFTAVDFNATEIAELVKASGAKYFVPTTKHHEGFTLWPSKAAWNWNAVDIGPQRDLVGELRDAILEVGGVHWGSYFSLMEWYNPFYENDKTYNQTNYVDLVSYPQLIDLVTKYKPEVIFSDGEWDMNSEYWRAPEFIAWLYNESPVKDTVVVNDRWGQECRCKHGGYYSCSDRYFPGTLQHHKWEDNDTVDKYSWGFRRTMQYADTQTLNYLISRLVIAISTGGNYLINIGPDANGRILPIFEERLRDLGTFVNAHEDAIFATKPWIFQNDSSIWYTSKVRNSTGLDPYRLYNNQTQDNTIIYAFILSWPTDNLINLPRVIPTTKTTVNLFGANGQNITLAWTQPSQLNGGIQVNIRGISKTKFASTYAIVLKIEYAADQNVNPIG